MSLSAHREHSPKRFFYKNMSGLRPLADRMSALRGRTTRRHRQATDISFRVEQSQEVFPASQLPARR